MKPLLKILKFNFPILALLIITNCSLYQDNEEPDIFYEFSDFDILDLGKNISDMVIDPSRPYIYLSDYNNNSVVKIDIDGSMSVVDQIIVGSHPAAIDLSPDNDHLIIALNGESNVIIVDLVSFSLQQSLPVSLMNMNDIVYVNETRVLISSESDPSVLSLSLSDSSEVYQSIHNGELVITSDGQFAFVASNTSVKKYDITNSYAIQEPYIADPFGFEAMINHFVISSTEDLLLTCLVDPSNNVKIKDVYAYNPNNLTLSGKYKINSPAMAVAFSPDESHIFVAPTDADKSGIYIVEFDTETKLESHYYLVAGDLKEKGLVVNPDGEYFYVLINSPGDNNSFEPYNNNSFDLQRVEIATY